MSLCVAMLFDVTFNLSYDGSICTSFIVYSIIFQYAIKHLRSTKGNIINIASMAGVHGQEMAMAYGVSKVFLSKSCPAEPRNIMLCKKNYIWVLADQEPVYVSLA